MRALWVPLLVLFLGVATAGTPPKGKSPKLAVDPDPARAFWLNLDKTTDTCGDYDYHPEGGMRSFSCHAASLLSWAQLQDLAGVPVFVAGPHTATALKLDSPDSFGHYNPAFVAWATQALIPGAGDPAFRRRTQPLYDAWVRPLARVHLQVWEKLQDDNACRQRELDGYMAAIESGAAQGYYERWFFFMNPAFCSHQGSDDWYFDHGFDGGVSGNVVKTAVGFWLRRQVDETADAWARALVALVTTYDPEWAREHPGLGK